MSNLFERYGIKEVADVVISEIVGDGTYRPRLYLDTLKISTIEQTAEQAEATGGKGNSPLIIWDYGKEITVSLQDALFSRKSMSMLFSDGSVADATTGTITKTDYYFATEDDEISIPSTGTFTLPNGTTVAATAVRFFDQQGIKVTSSMDAGVQYLRELDLPGKNISTITIDASAFPGTYRIIGDTFARSNATGRDEFFQFEIPMAKMGATNSITLEAAGDPSVFDMTMRVLRPTDGKMMILRMYDIGA